METNSHDKVRRMRWPLQTTHTHRTKGGKNLDEVLEGGGGVSSLSSTGLLGVICITDDTIGKLNGAYRECVRRYAK